MNRKGLGKLYVKLTPVERFKLDIEAMARGDEEESRRLVETCPRRSYVMNDLGFAGRWDGAIQMTLVTLLDLRPVVAKLRMIAAFCAVFPYCRTFAQDDAHFAYFDGREAGSRRAWERAGMEREPPGWEDDEGTAEENADPAMEEDLEKISLRVEKSFDLIPGLLDRLERELAAEAVAVWEAYTQFCEEETGLGAEKVLRATFEQALQNVRLQPAYCCQSPGIETGVLCRLWRKVLVCRKYSLCRRWDSNPHEVALTEI
jgi:hypothetical protein